MSCLHRPSKLHRSTLLSANTLTSSIKSLNSELTFLYRTLSRLRKRNHLNLILSHSSPIKKPNLSSKASSYMEILQAKFRNLFVLSAWAEYLLDEDLTEPTPIEEDQVEPEVAKEEAPPTEVEEAFEWNWPPDDSSSSKPVDTMLQVIVDAREPITFSIPSSAMSTPPSSPMTPGDSQPDQLFLPDISASQFYDFDRWLRSSRILPYHHHNTKYAMDDAVQRLRDAWRLGAEVGCVDYQFAAEEELRELNIQGSAGIV